MLEELHRTAGHVAWLNTQVAALEEDRLYGPVGGGQGGIPGMEPHVLIRMYQQERKHFTDVAKTCVAVGIEERRVLIVEREAERLAQYTRGLLADLGVLHRPEVAGLVRKHLTLVAGA